DGAVVIDLPPMLLGGVADLWQDEVAAIGPTGIDRGKGGKLLLSPPDGEVTVPAGYMHARSRSYRVVLGVRGFLVDGKPDHAVSEMRKLQVYPLAKAASPPAMTYINVSNSTIDTLFADTARFFDDLAEIVATEADHLSSAQRFDLWSIGIEK